MDNTLEEINHISNYIFGKYKSNLLTKEEAKAIFFKLIYPSETIQESTAKFIFKIAKTFNNRIDLNSN